MSRFNDIRDQFIFFSPSRAQFLDCGVVLQFGANLPQPVRLRNVTEKCSRQKNALIHSIPVVIHKEEVAKAEENIKVFSYFNASLLL